MKELEERILKDGKCLPGGILKVDNFINHQMDSALMFSCAAEFMRLFADLKIDKILTIEASGIAPAVFAGYLMRVPVVFAKKAVPKTMSTAFVTTVTSFTKKRDYTVFVSREYLNAGERILIIDDFLACGNAACGLADLCHQAGASVVALGFLVEKSFQGGRDLIARATPGARIESLASIASLDNGVIEFNARD